MAEEQPWLTIDGSEAAALVAYRASEVIAIYPSTPSSPMGKLADQWATARRPNLWSQGPRVVEMQSEGGAAGVLQGAHVAEPAAFERANYLKVLRSYALRARPPIVG